MKIRDEAREDIEAIRHINVHAFPSDVEANVIEALRNAAVPLISLVAEEKDEVVGHILFSPVQLQGTQGRISVAGLAPMAVLPAWQNRGVGAKLVTEGLGRCKAAGYDAVVVLGHPDYYPRFGFVASADHGITCEYNVPIEVFMIKELRKGALENVSGTIRYHQAFNEA